jgi:hypothetical protein
MPLLKAVAEMLSQNDVVGGIIEEIITVNELFGLLPFVNTNGKAYVYHRENTLPSVSFLDPNDVVPESTGDFTEIVTKLRILAGDVDVDKFLASTMSDHEPQLATQMGLKAKSMARTFQDSIVNGSAARNGKEFDGLKALVTAGQTIPIAANGGAMTLGALDTLIDAVPNGADFLMMRSGTRRAYTALIRAAGGNTAAMIQHKNFDVPVLSHNGVPIIVNDFLPGDEELGTSGASTASIYAVRANELDGFHGLTGGEAAGIVVEDIGTVQNKDATRTRIKWYVGAALKSTKSVARLSGVTNV